MSNNKQSSIDKFVEAIMKHDKSFEEFYKAEIDEAKAMHELEILQFMGHMLFKINGNALLTEDIEWCKQKYNERFGGNK
jgi:hypothetical protein